MKPLLSTLLISLLPCWASAAEFGTLVVTQLANSNNNLANASPGISIAYAPGKSPVGVFRTTANRGDYDMRFGFRFDGATPAADRANGIMMVSNSENGRSNQGGSIGAGLAFATPAIQASGNLGTPNPNWAGYSSSINVDNTSVTDSTDTKPLTVPQVSGESPLQTVPGESCSEQF